MHDKLQQMLDWKLLSGSHEWPGPDGGTCINEAAIVVAGLPYREVNGEYDFPPCFSRALGRILMTINDTSNNEFRQRLIRYVARLSGSSDSIRVEHRRALVFIDGVWKAYYEPKLRRIGLGEQCDLLACLQPGTHEYRSVYRNLHDSFSDIYRRGPVIIKIQDIGHVSPWFGQFGDTIEPITSCYETVHLDSIEWHGIRPALAAYNYTKYPGLFAQHLAKLIRGHDDRLITVLDRCFAIGNQAPPLETDVILARAAAARTAANARERSCIPEDSAP